MIVLRQTIGGQIVIAISTPPSSLATDCMAETFGGGPFIVSAVVMMAGGDDGLVQRRVGQQWLFGGGGLELVGAIFVRLVSRHCYMTGVTLKPMPPTLRHYPRGAICRSNETFTDSLVKVM